MDYVEKARALRADPAVHYNCCQAVLVTFADRLGLTPEQANALGAHFGSGMRHGSTCGAVSGALMVRACWAAMRSSPPHCSETSGHVTARWTAPTCSGLPRNGRAAQGPLRQLGPGDVSISGGTAQGAEHLTQTEEWAGTVRSPPTPLFHPPASPAAPRSAGALRSPPSRRSFSPVPPM